MTFRFLALVLAGLSGCGPSYSPDTYASNAAQQANKVEQGVVVGVRTVAVSAAGTVGTLTGAAAGGIAGSQLGVGPVSSFTALGGALVGGIGGSAVEHVTGDTTAFEYIVRKPNGDLVSVTQKDKTPLALGQKVLVIAGTQARVVPDYTVPPLSPTAKTAETVKADTASAEVKPADPRPADSQPAATRPPAAPDPAPAAPVETKPTGRQTEDGKPQPAASASAAAEQADQSATQARPAGSANP
ncbi:MAG: hypothetical protein ABSC06_17310 [Rhodopila sp.]